MENRLLAKIAEGVHRREYSLLLGAGASIGSLGGDNKPLPSGPQLRDLIVRKFGIPTEGQEIELHRAYAAAKRSDPHELESLIRNRFRNCKPEWQQILTEFNWHRIWTLNIDDIVENAYQSKGIDFDRFNWTSTFRDTAASKCQIIHLHGYAKNPIDCDESESEVVFSIAQYVSTLQDPRSWHTVFTDEFAERPIIVLGASLSDEFDLQQALSNSGSAVTRGFPSVIILNNISQLEHDELSSFGLIPIESDARTFMERLSIHTSEYRTNVRNIYQQNVDEYITRFLQQFVDLRRYRPGQSEKTRHFYEGFDPHWRNIMDGDDALFDTTMDAQSIIRETAFKDDVGQAVFLLSGGRGTGKSTGLLRIANGLIAAGFFVFQFRGDENLDLEAVVEWMKRNPKTVLIVNDCADFAVALADLVERCSSLSVNLVIVGCERSARLRFLKQKLGGRFLKNDWVREYGQLSDRDIVALVRKLGDRRRLGQITSRTRSQQHAYFRSTAGRRLFEGMANLEGGEGFRERVRSDYRQVDGDHVRRLYAATSMAYQFGYSVPMGIAAKVSGLSVNRLMSFVEGAGQDTILLDENGIRLPHRFTAALMVNSALTIDDRFQAMYRLTLALAPHIDVRSIRGLSRPYRLVRRLMHQESVSTNLGERRGRRFYELCQEAYDWNGRYWEQRALFESELGNHAQARSYAEHSLQIHRHPFALNTLGTILGRLAIQHGDAGILRKAIDNLKASRDIRTWEESEHPYITFVTTMIRFGQAWGMTSIPNQLRDRFFEWHSHASRSEMFHSAANEQSLQGFLRDWLALSAREVE